MHPQWSKWQLYGLMEVTLSVNLIGVLCCTVNPVNHATLEHIMGVMILWHTHFFYPGGETGWEDKKVLLEEFPVKHFPRVKRKYTRRKKPGIVRLLYDSIVYTQHVMYIMYIKLNDV